ncbi:sugar transferase [Aquimarina hainanensis]|uniref:Sugar transferase n=1 Tax=Aquimarina hainanensis TaxID=1578017 RepID=A0ABW5N9Q3_9FLAO
MISRTVGAEAIHYFKTKNQHLTTPVSSDSQPYTIRDTRKITLEQIITRRLGNQVCEFISEQVNHMRLQDVFLCDTRKVNGILDSDIYTCSAIINLHRVNDYRRINKFFESVNMKLPEGGLFINNVETYETRKKRILKKFPRPFSYAYYLTDFVFTRIMPKLKLTKKLYFDITNGHGRVLTKAETLGRLYSCGFEVIEEKVIDDRLYFVAKKVKRPNFDMDPSYGPLIRLKRVGKGGKPIKVYKFRTMYPYAEYLQQYVFECNDLKEGGKIKNDFRISNEGKLLRKYWIDELPMLLNLLKGEMKLVGGRPLSSHYFGLYSKELQEKRIRFKPGLIPPFYADLPKTLDEIMASEMRYLEAYEKKPLVTDIKYLCKIITNIVVRGKRSS